MTSRKNLLDRVEIASPCNADWDQMEGSKQIRYCSECHKYVYNLSELTRSEAETLVMTRGNQMCARLTRDLAGNTISVDSPPAIRLTGWRPGPVASTLLSALISIVPSRAALSQGLPSASPTSHSRDESGHKLSRTVPGAATAAITGKVSDENGAAKADAVVTLTSEASGEAFSQLTSQEGEFRFDGLPARIYIFSVQAQGYRLVRHHDVGLQKGEARRLDVSLEKLISMMGAMATPAQPLRTLYLESDRIVVGQVGKGAPEDKRTGSIKTSLSVSQTIKGDGHKPIVEVFHLSYASNRQFSEGETVLVFLQRREGTGAPNDEDSYELIYGATSVKLLSDSELETYLRRLEALKAILNNPDPNPADIVEWLVRCAEDPVTRREGAFELYQSEMTQKWKRELEDRNPGVQSLRTLLNGSADEEARFCLLLTGDQKQRLVTALLKSEEVVAGDYELIELVKRWDDPRLLPFLMDYLRRHAETAPKSLPRIMQTVADLVDDPKVTAIWDDYEENASYEDIEAKPVTESDEDRDAEEAEEEDMSDARDKDLKAVPTHKAAKLARIAMLKKFLTAAEAKIKATSPQQ